MSHRWMHKLTILLAALAASSWAGLAQANDNCIGDLVYETSSGTRFCASIFGPIQGDGWTGATGQFDLFGRAFDDDARSRRDAREICHTFQEQILEVTQSVRNGRYENIVIIQTWQLGGSRIQNHSSVLDLECQHLFGSSG